MDTIGNESASDLYDEFLDLGGDFQSLIERCREDEKSLLRASLRNLNEYLIITTREESFSQKSSEKLHRMLQEISKIEQLEVESQKRGVTVEKLRMLKAKEYLLRLGEQVFQNPLLHLGDALDIQVKTQMARGGAATSMFSVDEIQRQGIENRIKVQAEEVLNTYDCNFAPINMSLLSERMSLYVHEINLRNHSIEGGLVTNGTIGGVLINTVISNEARQRFTHAHEVGHFCLHKSSSIFQDVEANLHNYESLQELEANVFASSLLIPSSGLKRYYSPDQEPSFATMNILSDAYKVSLTAALTRMVRDSDYACAFVFSERGVAKFTVTSPYFGRRIRIGRKLSAGTVAAELFSSGGTGRSVKASDVLCSSWLWNSDDEESYLKEYSTKQDNYVFTILVEQ
jgi:Zn-dependent peptidase ImmA (M78 family)